MASTIALGRGDVVNRDEQVGRELHLRPVAERSDVVVHAREPLEHRNHRAIRGAVAAARRPTRSFVRACAPVPLSGQSSRMAPRSASVARACSFTSIGSVLVSMTITLRPNCASSFATWISAAADGSDVMIDRAPHPPRRARPSAVRRRRASAGGCAPGSEVIADDAEAAAHEVGRHRRSHDAETDHA